MKYGFEFQPDLGLGGGAVMPHDLTCDAAEFLVCVCAHVDLHALRDLCHGRGGSFTRSLSTFLRLPLPRSSNSLLRSTRANSRIKVKVTHQSDVIVYVGPDFPFWLPTSWEVLKVPDYLLQYLARAGSRVRASRGRIIHDALESARADVVFKSASKTSRAGSREYFIKVDFTIIAACPFFTANLKTSV